MYKISYEKCVCIIFLVILAFLSCSGFHIDKMIPLPDHNKKYLFNPLNFSENAYVSDFNTHNNQHHMMEQNRKFYQRGGDVRSGVPREHLVGALPLQELQRVYERRRKRRVRMARIKTHEERKNDNIQHTTNRNDQKSPAQINDPNRPRRAPERKRPNQKGDRKNRFCPGQDVATRAYHAKTVLEGKIRSKTKLYGSRSNLLYNVTYEVKVVLKDNSGFRRSVKNESIRLQFANDRGAKSGTCDNKKINGVVAAQFNYSKNYVLFADRIGDHEYRILGPPVESNRKTMQEIKNIVDGKLKVRSTRILKNLKDKTVEEGKKLQLQCRIGGYPPPLVRWHKNGQVIRDSKYRIEYKRRRTILKIPQVRLEDAGRYSCVAKGVIGPSVNSTAEVKIVRPRESRIEGSIRCNSDYSQFCMNGGTCLYFPSVAEYACQCAEGYNGNRCESKDVSSKFSTYGARTSECKLGLHSSYYC